MIKEFINIIKKYNEYLTKKINESNKYSDIHGIIDKIINKEAVNAEELDKFSHASIELLDKLDGSDKKRISFVIFLLKNNKDLDDSQIELFSKIKSLIKPKNIDGLNQNVEKNNILIEKLSSDEHFDNFEELIFAFDELNASDVDGISLSSKDKYNIINEIIKRNYKFNSNRVEQNIEEIDEALSDNLPEELVYRNNNEDDIKALLGRYNYDFDKLSNDNKEYLLKHLDINKADNILKLLNENGVHIKTRGQREVFLCKIIVNSSEEIIKTFKATCDKYGISFIDYIDEQPRILVPNRPRKLKKKLIGQGTDNKASTSGAFGNYKINIEFLEREGYNVAKIMDKCKGALSYNPYMLQHNLFVLEKEYGISFKSGDAFTGVINGSAIQNADSFIEVHENGLEYVRTNNSSLGNASPKSFYTIKVAKMEGVDLMYRDSTGRILKYSLSGKTDKDKYASDRRFIIITTSTEELKDKINPVQYKLENELQESLYPVLARSITYITKDVINNNYVKLLDSHYMVDEFTYIINGTRISRKKVLRIIKNLLSNNVDIGENEIKYALSFNSILTEKDLKNIENFRFAYASTNGGRVLNG